MSSAVSPIVSDREWNAHIMAKVASGKMTPEQGVAQLKTTVKTGGGTLSCKQSEKGALSVYGLQRMPVTLYAEQWERLLGFAGEHQELHPEPPRVVPQVILRHCPAPSSERAGA